MKERKNKRRSGSIDFRCNQGLGLFDDNTEILQSAIKYLRNFNKNNKYSRAR
jgi:hypothetical protein